MTLVFIRPKGLVSCKGIANLSDGVMSVVRGDKASRIEWPNVDFLFRWGYTGPTPHGFNGVTINKRGAIIRTSFKATFAGELSDAGLGPTCWFLPRDVDRFPVVVRPPTHSQGRNLWVAHTPEELLRVWHPGYYIRPLINKVAEYRVFVLNGKVITVARKVPDDPTQVAWNVSQGGRFENVRWGAWPLSVCDVAIKAVTLSGLDYSGVDVMTDEEDNAYVVELNSAPAIPLLPDGGVSYRQKLHVKAILWELSQLHYHRRSDEGGGGILAPPHPLRLASVTELPRTIRDYRDYLHPGVSA
jgi:hypothetical protein